MIEKTLQIDGFWPLQSLSEDLRILRDSKDSNSPSGSCLGSVRVHSLTLFCTLGSIRCASRVSLLFHSLASPCLGHEPKVRVATLCYYFAPCWEVACGSTFVPNWGSGYCASSGEVPELAAFSALVGETRVHNSLRGSVLRIYPFRHGGNADVTSEFADVVGFHCDHGTYGSFHVQVCCFYF
jgi:hypothetical protein